MHVQSCWWCLFFLVQFHLFPWKWLNWRQLFMRLWWQVWIVVKVRESWHDLKWVAWNEFQRFVFSCNNKVVAAKKSNLICLNVKSMVRSYVWPVQKERYLTPVKSRPWNEVELKKSLPNSLLMPLFIFPLPLLFPLQLLKSHNLSLVRDCSLKTFYKYKFQLGIQSHQLVQLFLYFILIPTHGMYGMRFCSYFGTLECTVAL